MKIGFIADPHLMDTPPRSRKDDYNRTILGKIKYVIDHNDEVLILGDLFHKPTVSHIVLSKLLDVLRYAKGLEKGVFLIPGNHDVSYATMAADNLERTSMSLLFKTGLLRELKCESFGPLVVEAIPYRRRVNNLKFKTEHRPSILVGHYFFESSLDPQYSITRDQIKGSGYASVILGHDHENQPVREFGQTMVFVPGSISRHTSHKFNLERNVRYCQVNVNEATGVVTHSFEDIPQMGATEVFLPEVFEKPEPTNHVFLQNMSDLLSAFQQIENKDGKITLKEALKTVGAPEFVVSYLRSIHQRLSINF